MRISDWSSDVCSSDLGAVQPDENVLLDQGSTGLTVFGETNQTQTSVSFRGLEDLTIPASGQSRIEAVDGGFQSLRFFLTNPLLVFEEVEFNIDSSAEGAATLTFFDQFGASFVNRSEEHTSELQSLMRTSYAVFCLKQK